MKNVVINRLNRDFKVLNLNIKIVDNTINIDEKDLNYGNKNVILDILIKHVTNSKIVFFRDLNPKNYLIKNQNWETDTTIFKISDLNEVAVNFLSVTHPEIDFIVENSDVFTREAAKLKVVTVTAVPPRNTTLNDPI